MSAHRLTTAATALPISVADAKDQSRILSDAEGTYVRKLIERATKRCENICKRAFITQTWTLTMDGFDDCTYVTNGMIYVPRPPLISVTSIAYLDTNGDSQTWASTQYRVDATSEPGRIETAYGVVYPTTRGVIGDVTIVHTAGYGASSSSVPEDLQHAIVVLAAHFFETREGERDMPQAVYDLLEPFIMEQYA